MSADRLDWGVANHSRGGTGRLMGDPGHAGNVRRLLPARGGNQRTVRLQVAFILVILEPSREASAIRPFSPNTKPRMDFFRVSLS